MDGKLLNLGFFWCIGRTNLSDYMVSTFLWRSPDRFVLYSWDLVLYRYIEHLVPAVNCIGYLCKRAQVTRCDGLPEPTAKLTNASQVNFKPGSDFKKSFKKTFTAWYLYLKYRNKLTAKVSIQSAILFFTFPILSWEFYLSSYSMQFSVVMV